MACGQNAPGCGRPTPVSDVFWTSTTIFNLGANQFLCCNRVRLSAPGDYVCRSYFQTVCPVLAPELKARQYWQILTVWYSTTTMDVPPNFESKWLVSSPAAPRAQFDCRIFLFTCNDAPAASADEAHAARTRVQDFLCSEFQVQSGAQKMFLDVLGFCLACLQHLWTALHLDSRWISDVH